jgi:hypothetical protein
MWWRNGACCSRAVQRRPSGSPKWLGAALSGPRAAPAAVLERAYRPWLAELQVALALASGERCTMCFLESRAVVAAALLR